jgi:hypothetical protein
MKKWLLSMSLILFSSLCWAQVEETPITTVESEPSRNRFYFNTNFFSLANPDTTTVSGYSLCPQITHYVNPRFSASGSLCQGLNSEGAFLFTQISLFGSYSLWGGNYNQQTKAKVNGKALVENRPFSQSEFLVGLGIDQIFLAGSDNTIPISGPSFRAEYHFSGTKDYHFSVNLSLSTLANGNNSYSLTTFGISIIF